MFSLHVPQLGIVLAIYSLLVEASYTWKSIGICSPAVNNCTQTGRCHLNPAIAQSSQQPPSWAPQPLQDLVKVTINQYAHNTTSNATVNYFSAGMVCDPTRQQPYWSDSMSINSYVQCWSAWASFGAYPFGNVSGYWFSIVIGGPNIEYPGYPTGSAIGPYFPYQQREPDDYYVSFTKLGDVRPVDNQFGLWPSIDAYAQYNSTQNQQLYEYAARTDNDLIANGYDVPCCKFNDTGCTTIQANGLPTAVWSNYTLQHFDCPDINLTWTMPAADSWEGSYLGTTAPNDTWGDYKCLYPAQPAKISRAGSWRYGESLWSSTAFSVAVGLLLPLALSPA
jgi:hypothetical protein